LSEPAPEGNDTTAGILYALAGYSFWGVAPLYFVWVNFAGPFEILAHRVLWSVILLLGLMSLRRGWSVLRSLGLAQYLWFGVSGLLIATNWGIFVWAVSEQRVLETSLGYYMNPLISVLLGVLVLGERLRVLQWLAVGIAGVGVAYETLQLGMVPWLGLSLAVTFALYSLVRKRVPIDPVAGLGVETLLMLPAAALYLGWLAINPPQPSATSAGELVPLLQLGLGGAVTILPLLLFGAALNRLPLTVLSFIQFLAPTLSLLVAVFVLGEAWRPGHFITFGCIWLGVLLFSSDLFYQQRKLGVGLVTAKA
jgi:chloramphenicol-sensitive protein RarD